MNLLTITGAGLFAAAAAALLRRVRPRPRSQPSRKELLRQAYREAANDTAYLAEMEEIDRAFDVTVGDGLEPHTTAHA